MFEQTLGEIMVRWMQFPLLTALIAGGSFVGQGQTQTPAPATANKITVPLSDPSKPGTLKVRLLSGDLTIRVGSSRDIVIDASSRGGSRSDSNRNRRQADASNGLRRLTQSPGLSAEEENNVVSVQSRSFDDPRLEIEVPAKTNLQLNLVNGGSIRVERVEGELEVNNINGDVTLTDVAGTVLAHSVNGKVTATVRQSDGQKPMAFTSMNGDVDVTLPASIKGSLKLRSDQGDVYSDFDITPTATAPSAPSPRNDRDNRSDRRSSRGRDSRFSAQVGGAVYGTVNGGGADIELRTFNGEVYLRKGR